MSRFLRACKTTSWADLKERGEDRTMLAGIMLLGCAALAATEPGGEATIAGTVRNASAKNAPLARAEVMLRVRSGGEFVPYARTTADGQGRFEFRGLPAGDDRLYLPGANRDGVHFPGPRVRFAPGQRRLTVELEVHDSVSAPNPLVIQRQEVTIRSTPGAVEVAETLVVDNPGPACFVGLAAAEDEDPITLQLAVPSKFDRATFQKEFFGRRFSVHGGKLVTSVPWPPGTRELTLTYQVPNQDRHYRWERPLDLPCAALRVCVKTDNPGEVSSSLALAASESGEVVFQSSGPLPAGHAVHVEIGKLPVPAMAYARWLALGVLFAAVAGGSAVAFGRRRG
jgi:hypothetical protein